MRHIAGKGCASAWVVVLTLIAGCNTRETKPEPPAATADTARAPATTTTTTPTPVAPGNEAERCPVCAAARSASVTFAFEGEFLDAQCTQPVAHADVPPCVPVSLANANQVSLAELVPARKGDKSEHKASVVRQLRGEEAAKLFQKRDGKCGPYEPLGFKQTPTGCDGAKVCRRANAELGCSGCRVLDTGCPDYVPSRVFVLLEAK